MSKWVVRVVLLAILCAAGIWLWRVVFPSQEKLIRKQLDEVAQLASFVPNEAPLTRLENAGALAKHCAPDVEIAVDIPGRIQRTFTGREEIRDAALAARSFGPGFQVAFVDVTVTLGLDKQSAEAHLTARGNLQGEQVVQELKFFFKKIEGKWLIQKVETVKTLSGRIFLRERAYL